MRAPPTRRDAARRPGEDGRGDETSADASSLDESATPMQANAALFEALPQAHFAALSRPLGAAAAASGAAAAVSAAAAAGPAIDLYPEVLRGDIERWNQRIYDAISNGVYKR